jgi:hypothetical protein
VGVADADSARSRLLRRHGCNGCSRGRPWCRTMRGATPKRSRGSVQRLSGWAKSICEIVRVGWGTAAAAVVVAAATAARTERVGKVERTGCQSVDKGRESGVGIVGGGSGELGVGVGSGEWRVAGGGLGTRSEEKKKKRRVGVYARWVSGGGGGVRLVVGSL